jgi:hypothetical protein
MWGGFRRFVEGVIADNAVSGFLSKATVLYIVRMYNN